MTPINLMICVTCQQGDDRPGARMHDTLQTALAGRTNIRLQAVECMSVCKRACTVGVSSPGKWTYIIGDLDAANDTQALCEYLTAYAGDPNGTPPLKQRPAAIRSGTIARIPPQKESHVAS